MSQEKVMVRDYKITQPSRLGVRVLLMSWALLTLKGCLIGRRRKWPNGSGHEPNRKRKR